MQTINSIVSKIPFLSRYSSFILNFLTSITGGFTAQIIGFICVPAIARIYNPEDFGVVALMLSICLIFSQTSSLCYDQAIILPKQDEVAIKILILSLFILILLCCFLTLGFFTIDSLFANKVWFKNLGRWVYVVPIIIFFTGFKNILFSWNTRKTHYTEIAKSQITSATMMNSAKIGIGLIAGSSVLGLVVGNVIGVLSGIGVLIKNINKEIDINNLVKIKKISYYFIAKEYKDFPMYSLPTEFLGDLSKSLVVILLGYFYSPEIVGYYAMCIRLFRRPLKVLIESIRRVYMQKVSELKNLGRPLCGSFLKTTAGLFIIACAPFLIINLWGKEIIAFALGDKWITTGVYIKILSPWLLTIFLLPPTNAILLVTRKNKFRFYYQIVAIIINSSSLVFGFMIFKKPDTALIIFSLTNTVTNLALIAKSFFIVKNGDLKSQSADHHQSYSTV